MRIRLAALAALVLLVLGAAPAARAQPPAPIHHQIDAWLDPEERYLWATVRTTVMDSGPLAVSLAPWLKVLALEVDGEPVTLSEQRSLAHLDLGQGDTHEILLRYGGVAPEATSQEAAATAARPFVSAEGSYFPGGSGWLPSIGRRLATYHLTMTVPDHSRIISSGRLVDEEISGGLYKAVVTSHRPAEEPSLFAGPYVIRERWHRGMRMRTYFHADLKDLAEDYLQRSTEYIDRFSDKVGDYPFADFFIISSPLPVGLGFPNLTYVSRKVLVLPYMRGRSLAHEILHNWWGNGVYVDYPDGNWSEGLTTYMADYGLAAEHGADAAKDMRLQWLRDFAALPSKQDFSVIAFTAKSHDADQVIGYNKVAFIFHMLEREIGASAFSEGIRAFWRNHRFQTAAWSDLRRAFEDASGHDLEVFFDQWLRRAGAPTLHLADARVERLPAGQQVAVTVGQDAPSYRLTVPVVVDTADRQVSTAIQLDRARAATVIEVASPPRSVSVDPTYQLFRRLDPSEMPPIFRSVTLDPATVAMVAAPDTDTDDLSVARNLATRLMGRDVRFVPLEPPPARETPVLFIGIGPAMESVLANIGLGPIPKSLAGPESARAWTGQRPGGAAFAVVTADSGQALAAVLHSLPHYGRMSYLTFEGGKPVLKGIWPINATPLHHDFVAR